MAELKLDQGQENRVVFDAASSLLGSPTAPHSSDAESDIDGTAALATARARRRRFYLGLGALYFLVAIALFWCLEGWDAGETSVFLLSIVTGCGYGHIVPATSAGKVATFFFILSGLILFATIAGQILDFLVQGEIECVVNAIRPGPGSEDPVSNQEKRLKQRRHHFLTGLLNLTLLLSCTICFLIVAWGHRPADALYAGAVTVLKLDNICSLDEVMCSHGWHASDGGNTVSLCVAVVWYVLTYGTIGHFLVAASSYLGTDAEARMTTVKRVDRNRLRRMDTDGDGAVTKLEFLRDRLIQGGLCSAGDIDHILSNFDDLDRDGSGELGNEDVEHA